MADGNGKAAGDTRDVEGGEVKMFNVVKKLLLSRQIKFEKGKISLFDQQIVILPVAEFSFVQDFLESRGLENLIYYSAKETGIAWLEKMVSQYGMKESNVIEWGCNILTLSGWGDLSLIKKDLSKHRIIFELKNATMGLHKKNKAYSTDHLIRGYVAAFATHTYKRDMDAVEVLCLSKGDAVCRYDIRARKDFDMSDPLVKKQLKRVDLSKIKVEP